MAIMNCARFDQYGTPRVAGMDSTTTTETLQSLLSDTDKKLIMVMWIVSMAMKVSTYAFYTRLVFTAEIKPVLFPGRCAFTELRIRLNQHARPRVRVR